jgi:signal transduction histidine kinase
VNVQGLTKDVVLSVHNEGVPIAPDKIETMFTALTRTSTEEIGGPTTLNLGLGLYITKEIVVSHGGTITVKSTEEEGTEFIVRFPR